MPLISDTLADYFCAWSSDLRSLSIYSGPIPVSGDSAPTGSLLVSWELTVAWPIAFTAIDGVVTALSMPASSFPAVAAGTAGYAMIWSNTSPVCSAYLTVGTSGAEVNLSTLAVNVGDVLTLQSASITFNPS